MNRLLTLLLCALPAAPVAAVGALTLHVPPAHPADVQAGFRIGTGGVLGSPAGTRVVAPSVPTVPPTGQPDGLDSDRRLDGDWVLVSAGGLRATGARGGAISFAAGQVSGTDGCDHFGGAVQVTARGADAGRVTAAGPLSRIPRACPPAQDARPSLTAALERGLSYRLGRSGDHRTLTLGSTDGPGAGSEWVYVPDPATPFRSGR